MVGYKRLKESSTKITERDEALIISCRACLFFIVFDDKKRIWNLNFCLLSNLDYWILLICLDMVQNWELHWELNWKDTHEGGLGVGGNYENYKMNFIKENFWTVLRHFMCPSQWLFLGHYILNRTAKNAHFWICLQICLKELAINTVKPLKKILHPLTFLKVLSLSFCRILKTSIS